MLMSQMEVLVAKIIVGDSSSYRLIGHERAVANLPVFNPLANALSSVAIAQVFDDDAVPVISIMADSTSVVEGARCSIYYQRESGNL